MSITLDLNQDAIFTAVGNFLVGVLPTGVEVVQGQANRVPPPRSGDYVVITPLMRLRLSTNVQTWDKGDVDPATFDLLSPGQLTLQCDVFGPNAANYTTIIETTWRSSYGCAALAALNPLVQPLYVETPRQLAFIDGEQQYVDRWSVDLVMQVNQTVTVAQDFAASLDLDLIEVDSTYPPS